MKGLEKYFGIYKNREILFIALLGFFSGLPLALTASTLTVWLTESGISKGTIGLFAVIGTPYTLKFLWSPIIDHMPLPFITKLFGRRRGWIMFIQILLIASIVGLAFSHPSVNPWDTAFWALLVAICSASQDIVIDAYRVERLTYEQLGPGAAAINFGYRIGMLVSGAGALFLAEFAGWINAYLTIAALFVAGIFVTLNTGEPAATKKVKEPQGLSKRISSAVIMPFSDFMKRRGWLFILCFIVIYKLGDALAGMMTNPFLIDIGFSKTEIATIVKTYGLVATLSGAFVGGSLVKRFGMMKSLFICGVVQVLSNMVFSLQALAGHNIWALMLTISVENFSSGMSSAAFVAYISSLCNINYTATQYALLSSLAVIGRTWISATSGYLAQSVGWFLFFLASASAAIPGLIMLYFLSRKYYQNK